MDDPAKAAYKTYRLAVILLFAGFYCVASSSFFQMRKHVNRQVMKQLVDASVISRLDYCNSILAGLLQCLRSQLQRVQNAAAVLVLRLTAAM